MIKAYWTKSLKKYIIFVGDRLVEVHALIGRDPDPENVLPDMYDAFFLDMLYAHSIEELLEIYDGAIKAVMDFLPIPPPFLTP